ncbi:alpha/beta hydrolase [Arthrobacter sp. 35W]|uniref:alpha/beta hydrolase n=1 Tax=Arthrobacter sp. 35W TaxID=1132441 RepID=UPI00047E8845|nr:alpha/beta hydrolase [Arthrobacter sp. 35W]
MPWQEDVLGAGFESAELHATHDSGAPRLATLVRYRNPDRPDTGPMPAQALLFLHGWSDYFFNTDLARFMDAAGIAFYALDMHNHGRSLRSGDIGGFVGDLRNYDSELAQAREAVVEDLRIRFPGNGADDGAAAAVVGRTPRVALMGHSTGGLVAALWASRNQHLVSHLILNSPWLEMHGGAFVRHTAFSLVQPLAKWWPTQRMRLPERNFYWRSISDTTGGDWNLDPALRPPKAFPIRMGWMGAILAGQAQVAKGLDIRVPILVMMSSRSMNGPLWSENMRAADVVLDVQSMAVRALGLGSSITFERIDGGLHDVLLSDKPVRDVAYERLGMWLRGYVLNDPPSTSRGNTHDRDD